mgnify:CR=1 FL=1
MNRFFGKTKKFGHALVFQTRHFIFVLKYLEHFISDTVIIKDIEERLCDDYCREQRKKMKTKVYMFLVDNTNIYNSFKRRPGCSNTIITYPNETFHRLLSPDPMGLTTRLPYYDCLNPFELVFIATAVMMAFSFLLLFYHRKKVRFRFNLYKRIWNYYRLVEY